MVTETTEVAGAIRLTMMKLAFSRKKRTSLNDDKIQDQHEPELLVQGGNSSKIGDCQLLQVT